MQPVPPPVSLEGARERIRRARTAAGRRTFVLDDDPTGSQSVHDVEVVTVLKKNTYESALEPAGATVFLLTNTRSLAETDAVAVNTEIGHEIFTIEQRLGEPVDLVSRSDSTLRGHVIAEVRALNAARRDVVGTGFDGVLLIPAYFEAGRITEGDIHWARVDGELVPVGDTEFARDATFGYAASNLRDFVSEKSGGDIPAEDVLSISLRDIREGGPRRVAEILGRASDCRFVVVNATDFADLEIVVLGLQIAQGNGKVFLYRTGPSFVRALLGMEPNNPLTAEDIWLDGRPPGHGLVVVGSHVGLTGRQLEAAVAQGGMEEVELAVPRLLDDADRDAHIEATVAQVTRALASTDVILYTSRTLQRGTDAEDSLKIARTVSTAVTEVVRSALDAHPAWVIAKGGITSHDVAVRGLGIRRARVLGQLLPGMVSVLSPEEAPAAVVGMPYVVFAGNVGDDDSLAAAIALFRGTGGPTVDEKLAGAR
ncbi:MAG TPA: four-carbon acid sugar kinase family protein [Microbacteriaceae bacterium]